jgi:glutamate N-acetyltransferase/amino-acid N-acetyltransferase
VEAKQPATTQPQEFLQPQGFLSAAKNAGIKDDTLDLTVIYSTARARGAAVFTQNRFPGAPVIVGRKHIADGFVQALVVNSKNANVAMGRQGIDDAVEMCRLVAEELDIDSEDVLPFSTGVIGRRLPMYKIRAGLKGIRDELRPNNLELAARAIMTTDRYPKYVSRQVGPCVIAGIAKGAGMIEPNMATMLVYLMTDAELPAASLWRDPSIRGNLKPVYTRFASTSPARSRAAARARRSSLPWRSRARSASRRRSASPSRW